MTAAKPPNFSILLARNLATVPRLQVKDMHILGKYDLPVLTKILPVVLRSTWKSSVLDK